MAMASNVHKYIYDLPFKPRRYLCDILDADRRWEELGGIMNYDVTTLTLIGQAIHRGRSPTWELLNKYSERNGTIEKLFIMLYHMDHQRAMTILKPYVESKYHQLFRNENTISTTAFTCSKKGDNPRLSLSQLSLSSNQGSVHNSSLHKHSSSSSHKQKEVSTASLKYGNNFVNMNKEFSSVSLHSKLNSLNVHHSNSKGVASKKSPDLSHFKRNPGSYDDESVSDNCISEKMKENKKISRQEASQIERPQKQSSHCACVVSINSQDECLIDIMRIPYEDIRKSTDFFNKDRILGRGGFGTVYRGEWKGVSVAIKRLTPRHCTDDPSQQLVSLKQSLNELNVLKTCRFDHILPLYAVSLDGENPCLIYQLMINGSLEDRLLLKNNTTPLTWSQRTHIAECTTKGLNYLHTTPGKPLVHGDIKSANILLDANMDAKIGDFGLTREGPGCQDTHVKVSSVHGTECYLPPEYLRHKHLSPQVDIYSYGIVLLEIATGLRPFDPKRGKGQRLAKFVQMCSESGCLESLRDTKAGEEKMICFCELIRIGQICSSDEKKKRPPMSKVLACFEEIKQEMSTFDKVRRLSNDKENSSPPPYLTPLERQIFFDLKSLDRTGASPNNKLSSSPGCSQEPGTTNGTVETHEPPKDNAVSLKPSSPVSHNLGTIESCGSSGSYQNGTNFMNVPPETSKGTWVDQSSPEVKTPVIPLISLLRNQVPISDALSRDCTSSQMDNSVSSSTNYSTDD